MLRFRRRIRAGNTAVKKTSASGASQVAEKVAASNNISCSGEITRPYIFDFPVHMSKYIGQTVTVFVNSGGMSGMGFTGILLSVNEVYIRLIVRIGAAPSCSLGNSCSFYPSSWPYTNLNYIKTGNGIPVFVASLGSVADIPVDKIASFVHNAV